MAAGAWWSRRMQGEMPMKVLVLGGGVIGTTTAYFLARHGHEVEVIERRHDVGQETSFANGGIIHISLVEPWNEPGIAFKLFKWIGREDSPALLRPSAIPGMLSWGLQFLRNSARARHERHTLVNLRLALYSASVLRELRAQANVRYDHATTGLLKLFRDPASLEHSAAVAERLRPYGVPHRALDAREVVELEPSVAPIAGELKGALHFPDDESGDARMFTRALADEAEREGVRFHLDTTIEGIEAEGDRIGGVVTDKGRLQADTYVLALGSHSPMMARPLGLRLPVYPVKGYSLTAPKGGWNDAPRMVVTDERLKVGITILGDRIRMAGSAEFTGYDATPNERRADYIWQMASRVFPAIARHVERSSAQAWSGLRPMTPDGPPLLGPTRYPNLFLNTGHGHLGWTMACGSARAVADLVSGRRPAIDLNGLTAARFAA
jgi:D-amino-acid dehydrogenase